MITSRRILFLFLTSVLCLSTTDGSNDVAPDIEDEVLCDCSKERDAAIAESTSNANAACSARIISTEANFETEMTLMKDEIRSAHLKIDNCTAANLTTLKEAEGLKEKLELNQQDMAAANLNLEKCSSDLTSVTSTLKISNEKLDLVEDNMEKTVSSYEEKLSSCRKVTAENEADYNQALQSLTALEENHKRLQSSHEKKVSVLNDKINSLSSEVKKLEKSVESFRERYYDARADVTKYESELRNMHRKAVSTYFNTTLVMEDVKTFTSRRMNKAFLWFRVKAVPYYYTVERTVLERYSTILRNASPQLDMLEEGYSKHVSPQIRTMKMVFKKVKGEFSQLISDNPFIEKLWKDYGVPMRVKSKDLLEGVRLSLISVLEQSSKTLLTYLELNKDSEKIAPPLERSIIEKIQYVNTNAENIVHYCVYYFLIISGLWYFTHPLYKVTVFVLSLPFLPFLYLCRFFTNDKDKANIRKSRTQTSEAKHVSIQRDLPKTKKSGRKKPQ